jgi:ribonucleoside-diphosphate reductase alpha chain
MSTKYDVDLLGGKRPSFYWYNQASRQFLKKGYTELEAPDRIREMGDAAERYLNWPGFSDRFFEHMSNGLFSIASPIWANFGKKRGLPISCNGVYVGDSCAEIARKNMVIAMQTKNGAGTSAYFGAVRGRGADISTGGKSNGSVEFMTTFDRSIEVYSQSNVRRGVMAMYTDVTHPDFDEFIENIREIGAPMQSLHPGVCIPDSFMHKVREQEQLVTQAVVNNEAPPETPELDRFLRILRKRTEHGYPYLFFTDSAQRRKAKVYRDLKMTVWASNVCTEILLPASEVESFVCDLSSLNLENWDLIEQSEDAIEILYAFLDAVMTEYVEKSANEPGMECSNRFARRHRAIGIGILGWHSYLMRHMLAFESFEALMLGNRISKTIRERCDKMNLFMGAKYGSPELLEGTGLRNTTTMAYAPTKSSSIILGQVSSSFEPISSNVEVKQSAKGQIIVKNPQLERYLQLIGHDRKEVWDQIVEDAGSVQLLDFLDDHAKSVFKVFSEVSQAAVIQQAAGRQRYLDQTQSLNLIIDPDTSVAEIYRLHMMLWEADLPTAYYLKTSESDVKIQNDLIKNQIRGTEARKKPKRDILGCAACEA